MYGKVTVGYGTNAQKELEIVDFVQAHFKDNRTISISQIEDGSFVGTVENPLSTGRNPQSSIWLSKESFIGLISTALLYFNIKGEDLENILRESTKGNDVDYSFSDNLDGIIHE
jgi:hypothetical protein